MSNGDIHGEGRGRVVTGPSVGGPTGFAITPARELRPRSDWSHLWIPVVGPLIGGGAFRDRLQSSPLIPAAF